MTADEMFLELGYIKNTSVCYGEDKGKLLYEKPVMGGTDIFEIRFQDKAVWHTNTAAYSVMTKWALLKAIMVKLKELGWADED